MSESTSGGGDTFSEREAWAGKGRLVRANAPRLIEWTGERFVPWVSDSQLAYEHLHRYAWARDYLVGRDVLDLGSGEGIGANIIGSVARTVIGVDIDESAVAHATTKYSSETLKFIVGDARHLDELDSACVDAVVAFEVIEHVSNQAAVLDAIARVLRPGGLLLISTPNRLLYRRGEESPNPFHEHELDIGEFQELLGRAFPNVALYVQRAQAGSRIDALTSNLTSGERIVRFERLGETWIEVGLPAPYYLLAIASTSPLPSLAEGSTLVDASLDIVRTTREAVAHDLAEGYEAARRDQIESLLAEHQRELAVARERGDRLAEQVDQIRGEQQRSVARLEVAHREDLLLLQSALTEAEAETEAARADVRRSAAGAAQAHQLASRVQGSITWRALERIRNRLYHPDGRPTPVGWVASRFLRLLHFLFGNRAPHQCGARPMGPFSAAPDGAERANSRPLILPRSSRPLVSIVIPVYRGASLLRKCLGALGSSVGDIPFETIIVNDDPSDEGVAKLLFATRGVRVVGNESNLGFLASTNLGVAASLGEYIVLLNSDTEPQPGWLEFLIDRFKRVPELAVAGSCLIYPDGRLQEAGGIVFADGSAMNYGNGGDPSDPRYTFARPVDYCSAAAVMVRRSVWDELDGFDAIYSPAYYEDVDFCFRARRAGYEVWFEPRARVIHHEGGSHGTNLSEGVKRYQRVNQERFFDRWRDELSDVAMRPRDVNSAGVVADRRRGPRIVIYDHQIPVADQDAGSFRMHMILEFLSQAGARPLFVPANGADLPGYRGLLESAGVEVAVAPWSPDLYSVMGGVGRDVDAVILSRVLVAAPVLPLVREHCPRALVVFDTVDLHHRREAGRLAGRGNKADTVPSAYRELEYAVMRACDLTLVVSREEQKEVLEELPDLPVAVVPVASAVRAAVPPSANRRGFVFVGGYRHPPNVDAARWLGESIWPAARAAGVSGPLALVGPDAPSELFELEDGDLAVHGWVEDLESVLDGAVALVAPLRYGAGIKGKITQALASGLPVITTAVGAEGLDLVHGESVLIARSENDFVEAMRRVESDVDLWQRLSVNGRDCVRGTNSLDALRDSLGAIFQRIDA